MKKLFSTIVCILGFNLVLTANTDDRYWTPVEGKGFRAELVSYDPETKVVVLKFNDSEDKQFNADYFSLVDRAWLIEWHEFGQGLDTILEKEGGETVRYVTKGNFPTELFVYYPASYKPAGDLLPALILFHPSGRAVRNLKRHLEAANASGLILISCGTFRNTGDDPIKEGQLLERFKEVFPQILQLVRFDHKKLFMGGTSGGAWRAFHYSAWIDFPWAGIYSNVGWLGDEKYYGLDYRDDMRVALVNGNMDHAANRSVKTVSNIMAKHNATIAVLSFEGGHQMPPPATQKKTFNWLLEKEDFISE